MKILITGGNGNISWWFVELAIKYGHQIYVLNRNASKPTRRNFPTEVIRISCDYRNFKETQEAIKKYNFDVVCDFICYNQQEAKQAIELFKNKTRHYILISSESIYQRKTKYLPFKENTPLNDPKKSGKYIAGKIEAETELKKAFENFAFPLTIIRPAYTYDTILPTSIGMTCFTAVNRYMLDKTALLAGDGMNLRTFTHSRDFARALLGVIGNHNAIGEDFHITTDEWLTWNDTTEIIVQHLHIQNPKIIHIPREKIFSFELLGDADILDQKMSHNIFDNSKIKKLLPTWSAQIGFQEGIRETLDWLFEDTIRQRINLSLDALILNITKDFR